MKQSITKSCDILFITVRGYYQVTEAKDDFPYSPALQTKPKHCFDDLQTFLAVNTRHNSSEQSHDVKQP